MKNENTQNNDNSAERVFTFHDLFNFLLLSKFVESHDKVYIYPTASGKTFLNTIQLVGRSLRQAKNKEFVIMNYNVKEGADLNILSDHLDQVNQILVDESHSSAKNAFLKFKINPSKESKASYEEHVEFAKTFKNARAYDMAKKDSKFYSTTAFLKKAFKNKTLQDDVGWTNMFDEKASYEEHVNECKKYKSGLQYNKAVKSSHFYKNADTVKRVFGKDFSKIVGWSK